METGLFQYAIQKKEENPNMSISPDHSMLHNLQNEGNNQNKFQHSLGWDGLHVGAKDLRKLPTTNGLMYANKNRPTTNGTELIRECSNWICDSECHHII